MPGSDRSPQVRDGPAGRPRIETRSWSTRYRGPLAIHAAKRPAKFADMKALVGDQPEAWDAWYTAGLVAPDGSTDEMPYGAIVATCTLTDVIPMVDEIPPQDEWREPWGCMTIEPWPIEFWWPGFGSAEGKYRGDQRPYGDFAPGRFAWLLDNIERIEPRPTPGRQGLWEVSD